MNRLLRRVNVPAVTEITVLVGLTALAGTPLIDRIWQRLAIAAISVAVGVMLLRRQSGYCRACGRPVKWTDPLTVFRRHRVHARHLPAIRASHRASRTARPYNEGVIR